MDLAGKNRRDGFDVNKWNLRQLALIALWIKA